MAGLLLVALGLRLEGITFGLPALYHPDEPAYVLQALALEQRLPQGLTFADPPLFKYLLLAEYTATYALQRLLGTTRSTTDFIAEFHADPSLLYLEARVTSALCGAATVAATAALGQVLGGRRAGLLAAALSSLTFLLVREAHFGVNDALVTLLVTLGLVACVRVTRGGGRLDSVLAGVLAGLAFAAKYYGIVLLVPLVLAHLWACRCPHTSRTNLVLSVIACLLAAVVGFPSLLTEPARVGQDVYTHLYVAARTGYDGIDTSGGYLFYVGALGVGLGWPLLIAAFVGAVLLVQEHRRRRPALVVAALPLVFLGVLGSQRLYFARFALPAVPVLIVIASLALDRLMSVQRLVGGLAALLVALPTGVDSVRFDAILNQADTRTLASTWIGTNLPPSASLAGDTPPFGPGLASPGAVPPTDAVFDLSPAEYRMDGVEYLVVSSFTLEARAIDPTREARREAFGPELAGSATVVAQFRPYAGAAEPRFAYDQVYGPWTALDRLVGPGPTITIYRLTE